MKNYAKYGVLLILIMAVIATLIACASPTPTPTPKPTTPAPTATPTPAPAPKPSPTTPATVSAADFYKNNTVTIVVPFGAGGGTDFAGRLVAAFWADVTGGDARVKNMPGGGGLVGMNAVWNAKPDGLTLGVMAVNTVTGPVLFKDPGTAYDMGKFNYIGLYGEEPYTFAVGKDLAYSSVADLQKVTGIKFGATDIRTGPGLSTALAIDILGLKDSVVIGGYKSTPEITLAIARGEVQALVYPSGTIKTEADKGFVKPIANIGFIKSVVYPNVLPVSEIIKLSPQHEKLLRLHSDAFRAGRLLIAPPGVSGDRVQFLRDSFDRMVKLTGFQDHAKSRYYAFEPPLSGKQVAEFMNRLAATPQADLDALLETSKKYAK